MFAPGAKISWYKLTHKPEVSGIIRGRGKPGGGARIDAPPLLALIRRNRVFLLFVPRIGHFWRLVQEILPEIDFSGRSKPGGGARASLNLVRLVFKAHRLVYHPTLGLREIKKKKRVVERASTPLRAVANANSAQIRQSRPFKTVTAIYLKYIGQSRPSTWHI